MKTNLDTIQEVAEYIDDHLEERLDSDSLCEAARLLIFTNSSHGYCFFVIGQCRRKLHVKKKSTGLKFRCTLEKENNKAIIHPDDAKGKRPPQSRHIFTRLFYCGG